MDNKDIHYNFIDVGKFFASLFVIFMHIILPGYIEQYKIVQTGVIAFFFFASGFVFKEDNSDKSFFSFFASLFNKTIIPYTIFSLIGLIIGYYFPDWYEGKTTTEIWNAILIDGKPLICGHVWFLLCFFWCSLFFFLIWKLIAKFNRKLRVMLLFILLIVAYLVALYAIEVEVLPLKISQSVVALIFYTSGFLSKTFVEYLPTIKNKLSNKFTGIINLKNKITKNEKFPIILIDTLKEYNIIYFIIFAICRKIIIDGELNLIGYSNICDNYYDNFNVYLFLQFIGIISFLSIGKLFENYKKLKYLGQINIYIYLIHLPILWIVELYYCKIIKIDPTFQFENNKDIIILLIVTYVFSALFALLYKNAKKIVLRIAFGLLPFVLLILAYNVEHYNLGYAVTDENSERYVKSFIIKQKDFLNYIDESNYHKRKEILKEKFSIDNEEIQEKIITNKSNNEMNKIDYIISKDEYIFKTFSDENYILYLGVPYNIGYKLYVNGDDKEIFVTKDGNMAIELNKGENDVLFVFDKTINKLLWTLVFLFFVLVLHNYTCGIVNKKILIALINIIKIGLIFCFSYYLISFVNDYVMYEAFYMDDLENYIAYLDNKSLFKWIFGYTEGQIHYRPMFYVFLLNIFKIVTKNVTAVLTVNFVLNAIIAVEIFYIMQRLKINIYLSISTVALFIVAHFSTFQIAQCIGCIETVAMFFALLILYLCIKVSGETKYQKIYIFLLMLFYPLVIFTHERYLGLIVMIITAICLNVEYLKKKKLILSLMFIFELAIVFVIRYHFLKKWIPVGTGCIPVEDTFNLPNAILFAFSQVAYIFGYNVGEEYICGINFLNINPYVQMVIVHSSIILLIIFVMHIVKNILKYRINIYNYRIDIIFIVFCAMCIIESSVCIRVELRWVYTSFIGFMIYISYIVQKAVNDEMIGKIQKIVVISLFTVFFGSRVFIELYHHQFNNNIFLLYDLNVVNSLANHTINKYGKDEIQNKKVYILNNKFDLKGRFVYDFYAPFYGTKSDKKVIEIISVEDAALMERDDSMIFLVEDDVTRNYFKLY